MENLIFGVEEIAPILKGHIFIEKILETLISNHLNKPEPFFKKRRTFDLKIDLAVAMGLLDKKHTSAFKAINNIRNNYAHKHIYQVTLVELNALKFEWEDIQNKAYKVACEKSINEAAKLATIFLCWKAIHLIKNPNDE